jgi:hypothetical protein
MDKKSKITDLTKENGRVIKEHRQKIQKINDMIDQLNQEKNNMTYPHWITEIIEPLGETIATELGTNFRVLGPFGLQNEVAIHFGKDFDTDTKSEYSIHLVPINIEEGKIAYKDYSKRTEKYPKGSIGEVNGWNYENIEITDDMTIKDLIDVIKNQE